MTTPDSQRVVPVELLPCPFCNAEPAYFSGTNIQYGHGESSDYAGVRCSVCRVEISFCNYAGYQLTERMALAAEKWNRRAPSASPPVAPVVGDLSMLVRKLVHSLRKTGSNNALCDRAVDYLKRTGIAGSILRTSAPLEDAQDRVSCWRLITRTGPQAWIDGLPPTRNDAEMEAEKRLGWSDELAYSRPPAQTQPASPEDRRDAERYRWLRRKVSAHGVIDGWAFGFPTHLSLPAPIEAMRDPSGALDAAIDAAREG